MQGSFILWGSARGRERLMNLAAEMGYDGPVRTRDDLPRLRALQPETRRSDQEIDFAALGQLLRDLSYGRSEP